MLPAAGVDPQSWNELDITLPVSPRLELTWESLARVSSDKGGVVTYAGGLYANVAIGDHLTIGPFYDRYVVYSYSSRQWMHTREPGVELTLTTGASQPCELSDRSRLYRVLGQDFWVYRNRPRIDCRIGPARDDVKVFVADELFHYTSYGNWTRNRFTSGVHVTFNQRSAIELYYLRQTDERQIPDHIAGIGITLELRVGAVH